MPSWISAFRRRLQSSHVRPSGHLTFTGAPKQSGLSAFAQYLAPDEVQGSADATYRFPAMGENDKSYQVELWEHSTYTSVQFSLKGRSI
ncbi:hypothetical protein AAVH_17524 [Aphelenchoides avenae]|nr:hypothetical protein AAVH_17524 [Aphelenchus avenae]